MQKKISFGIKSFFAEDFSQKHAVVKIKMKNNILIIGSMNYDLVVSADGVLLAKKGFRKRIPAYSVDAVDTVAAGDAFVGAFAVALSEGIPEDQAVELVKEAAAISVTRRGAQPSLPTRAEIQNFIQNRH